MTPAWSDAKKWRMDLLKSAISWTVAAIVSFFVVGCLEEKRAVEKAKFDAEYATRLKALEDFRIATVNYDSAATAAFTDLFQWDPPTRTKTAPMLRYEQEVFPKWTAAIETVAHLFPAQERALSELRCTAGARHVIYDRLVDQRLDRAAEEIHPWRRRDEFRALNEKLSVQRAEIIQELQASVFPPHKP